MSDKTLNPPQPIPYPDHWLMKKLYKTPILLYRLGLKKLFGKSILILSTTGRISKKIHRTPVEYFEHEGHIYIISGFGSQPDWYQNIKAKPQVTIQTAHETSQVTARHPKTEGEWQAVFEYLTHSPIAKTFMEESLADFGQTKILDEIKSWPALTFDPTDESCPPPLEADLVWAWPLILLLFALNILTGWLIHRQK